MTNPFAVLHIVDSDEQVTNNCNLHVRIGELKRCLEQYDMSEVYHILQFSSLAPNVSLPKSISLLGNWDGVTETILTQHTFFLKRNRQV